MKKQGGWNPFLDRAAGAQCAVWCALGISVLLIGFTPGDPPQGQAVFAASPGVTQRPSLKGPRAVAVGRGALYIADTENGRVLRITLSGDVCEVLRGLIRPTGLVFDSFTGNLYVAETGRNRILCIPPPSPQSPNPCQPAVQICLSIPGLLMEPTGLAVDGFGNVYIADTGHDQIWFWPRGDRRLCVVNTEMAGGLSRPTSLVVDAAGILYIADTGHNRVLRMVASCNPGNIAEIDTNPFSLNGPSGLTVCGGNLFIADTGNDRVLRYPVLLGRGSVLFAGGGTMLGCNYTGSALEARLSKPTGLAVDGPCCVYIADTGNHCIRRVCLSNGVIEPVFGP